MSDDQRVLLQVRCSQGEKDRWVSAFGQGKLSLIVRRLLNDATTARPPSVEDRRAVVPSGTDQEIDLTGTCERTGFPVMACLCLVCKRSKLDLDQPTSLTAKGGSAWPS